VIALREQHQWSFQRIATYLGGFRLPGSYQVEYSRKLNLTKRGTRVYQLPPGWSLAAADSLSAWRALPPAGAIPAGSGAISTAPKRPAEEPADEARAKRAKTAASDDEDDEETFAAIAALLSSPPSSPPSAPQAPAPAPSTRQTTKRSRPTELEGAPPAKKVKAQTFTHPAAAVDAAGRTRRATRLASEQVDINRSKRRCFILITANSLSGC
jgi:hypothetical protein